MMPAIETPHTHGMSELLVGGDWACANNDVGTLARIAEMLAPCLAEPLRVELLEFARLCHDDAEQASNRWYTTRERLRLRLRAGEPGWPPCDSLPDETH